MYEWRTGRSCIFKNNVHLVFVTKYRRGVFSKEMLDRLEVIYRETCEQMDCELLEFGGEHDHVHLMLSVHPKLAVSNLVREVADKNIPSSSPRRRGSTTVVDSRLRGNDGQPVCFVMPLP